MTASPRRGRPRSEKAQTAILHAAAELLLNRGLDAVGMDAVAERAGVSKATIYRWWPNKEALALDALYSEWAEADAAMPHTGSLREDLVALLRPWARLVRSRPYARVIGTLVAKANSDPEFAAEYLTRLVKPRRDQAGAVLRRAAERGELDTGVRIDVALDLLYGALYHRLLHGHAPISDRFVADVVDTTMHGIAASPPKTAPRRGTSKPTRRSTP
jgi:AcrR family transcriptional regulator